MAAHCGVLNDAFCDIFDIPYRVGRFTVDIYTSLNKHEGIIDAINQPMLLSEHANCTMNFLSTKLAGRKF